LEAAFEKGILPERGSSSYIELNLNHGYQELVPSSGDSADTKKRRSSFSVRKRRKGVREEGKVWGKVSKGGGILLSARASDQGPRKRRREPMSKSNR